MSVDTERPLEPGTIVARNYRVTERLGAGGMGTVYLAENLTLHQRVVVKVLRGGGAGAGQEEAQMLANLQHPNVVTVYAHDPALDCIVMEFLDGESLATLLERGVDRVSAIRIALAVAEALAAVHKRGLVHRDLKPENVMLALNQGGGGRFVDWLKLIDFGTALKTGKVPPVLLGTPEFCGPEQFHSEGAHPGNDVYALGSCIHLMMTGVYLFDVPREDLARAHHEDEPPRLIEQLERAAGKGAFDPRTHALLEDLSELVQQMVAKTPAERPTAQEVARRLSRLESSFAEAGTYVGTGISSPALQEVTAPARKKGTAVLTREHRAVRAPTTDRTMRPRPGADASSTAPHLPPVQVPPSAKRPAPTTAVVTRTAKGGPPGPSRALIGGLVALVLALVAALVVLGPHDAGPAAGVDSSPPQVDASTALVAPAPAKPGDDAPAPVDPAPPAKRNDGGADPAEAPPAPTAGVKDDPPRDAGAPELPDDVTSLPTALRPRPKVGKAPPPSDCRFDDRFASEARAKFQALVQQLPVARRDALEDEEESLAVALQAKDCKRTRAVLNRVAGLVRSTPK